MENLEEKTKLTPPGAARSLLAMLSDCSNSVDEVLGVCSRWEDGLRKCEFIPAVSGSSAKLTTDEGFELLVLSKLFRA